MKIKDYLLESMSLKTRKDQTGHVHNLKVNADGDGKTTSTSKDFDHVHTIFQWMIQPDSGHIHNLEEF